MFPSRCARRERPKRPGEPQSVNMKENIKTQIMENAFDALVIIDEHGKVTYWNASAERIFGFSAEEMMGKDVHKILMPKEYWQDFKRDFERFKKTGLGPVVEKTLELTAKTKSGGKIPIEISVSPIRRGNGYSAVAAIRDISERRATEEKLHNQAQMLSWLYDAAYRFTQALDVGVIARETVRLCVEAFGATLAWLGYAEEDGSVKVLAHYPEEISYLNEISVRWDEAEEGQGPTGRAIREGQPQICNDIESEPSFAPWKKKASKAGLRNSVALPLITRNRVFGALNLYSDKSGHFTPDRVRHLESFAHMSANALENARLYEETNRRIRRIRRIQALRNIDMAITGSLDLRVVYRVALEEIVTQLKVDAACILIHNPHDNSLEIVAEKGFSRTSIGRSLYARETTAGRVFREHKIVHIPDLREVDRDKFSRRDFMVEQGFISYYGVPLVAKGKLLGVLEVFQSKLNNNQEEWINYLETLGGQVAIAIENAALVDDLRLKHQDLLNAYDDTLEGWGKALSLKEEETAEHSERVTQMTVQIAKRMGIRGEDLIQVRRGALLHDIGKIGIPDSILLKPGKLMEEEWVIMRKHPVYAFEMLSPITYLRKAIDVPYCHHEKWDGTGYPRGLKGKQIPLSARIFAIVDVWDALTNDRPYRKAWPQDKTMEYIKELSGTHFDPEVVEVFLKYLSEESRR